MADIIVILILVLIVFLAIRYIVRKRKSGSACMGCSQCKACKGEDCTSKEK